VINFGVYVGTEVKYLRIQDMKAGQFTVMLKALDANLIRATGAWVAGAFRNPTRNGPPTCEEGAFPWQIES